MRKTAKSTKKQGVSKHLVCSGANSGARSRRKPGWRKSTRAEARVAQIHPTAIAAEEDGKNKEN